MNPNERYVMSQVNPMLAEYEQVLFLSTMRRQPGLLVQLLLLGGLLSFLMTKFYFVAFTNRRIILIRSKVGLFSFSGAPDHVNLGVEQWDVRNIEKVTVGGFANNRSMTFWMSNGPKQTLRISPWMRAIPGTKQFFEEVPAIINSRQLSADAFTGGLPPQLGYGRGVDGQIVKLPPAGPTRNEYPDGIPMPLYGMPPRS